MFLHIVSYNCFCFINQTRFEVTESSDEHAQSQYIFIGYMTIYKFYAYPDNLRPRLSQIFVLPPFRKCGHATQFLMTFYRDFIHVPNVLDITGKFCLCIDQYRSSSVRGSKSIYDHQTHEFRWIQYTLEAASIIQSQ